MAKEKVKKHLLSVSYPLIKGSVADDQILKIASYLDFKDDGSGAGFGQRDLEFYFTGTKTQFKQRLKLLKDSLKDIGCSFSC